MPAIILTDGSRVAGRSFHAIERKLRRDKWAPHLPTAFRAEIARRAVVWSGTVVRQTVTSKRFIADMERARMCIIEEETP